MPTRTISTSHRSRQFSAVIFASLFFIPDTVFCQQNAPSDVEALAAVDLSAFDPPAIDVSSLTTSEYLIKTALKGRSVPKQFGEQLTRVRYVYPAFMTTTPDQEAMLVSGERWVDRRPQFAPLIALVGIAAPLETRGKLDRPLRQMAKRLESGMLDPANEEIHYQNLLTQWRMQLLSRFDVSAQPDALKKLHEALEASPDGEAWRSVDARLFGPMAVGKPDVLAATAAIASLETWPPKAWLERLDQVRQIGVGLYVYEARHRQFPKPFGHEIRVGELVGEQLSWRVHLLPILGFEKLYQRFDLAQAWDSPQNKPLIAEMPDIYRLSNDSAEGHTPMQLLTGPTSLWSSETPKPDSIKDGTSMTVALIATGHDRAVPWTQPTDVVYEQGSGTAAFGKPSWPEELEGAAWIALDFAGAVKLLDAGADPETVDRLVNPRDGQTFDESVLRSAKRRLAE